jgi:hypothetical protein
MRHAPAMRCPPDLYRRSIHSKEMNMNVLSKTMVPTALVGLLLGFNPAAKAEQSHFVTSNAVDKCQAFTPGVTNTIRNRVTGAENVGSSAIPVACDFELSETYGLGYPTIDDVYIALKNGSATDMDISCTLLPGSLFETGAGSLSTKTITLTPGQVYYIRWSTGDGAPWSTNAIGATCSLPPQGQIVHTILRYRNDS